MYASPRGCYLRCNTTHLLAEGIRGPRFVVKLRVVGSVVTRATRGDATADGSVAMTTAISAAANIVLLLLLPIHALAPALAIALMFSGAFGLVLTHAHTDALAWLVRT